MKKNIFLFLCSLILIFGFSAWVFATPTSNADPQKEKIQQICWDALDQEYGVHMSDIAIGQPTFAVKDDQGVISSWKELSGDVSVYVYGEVSENGQTIPYYAFYSLTLNQVVSCELGN